MIKEGADKHIFYGINIAEAFSDFSGEDDDLEAIVRELSLRIQHEAPPANINGFLTSLYELAVRKANDPHYQNVFQATLLQLKEETVRNLHKAHVTTSPDVNWEMKLAQTALSGSSWVGGLTVEQRVEMLRETPSDSIADYYDFGLSLMDGLTSEGRFGILRQLVQHAKVNNREQEDGASFLNESYELQRNLFSQTVDA